MCNFIQGQRIYLISIKTVRIEKNDRIQENDQHVNIVILHELG